jgi:tRNA (guanine-N(7)-)-methyltransferase subunit TRM82
MPKRPCALDITRDNQTLIVGDKFGDVYALPLKGKVKQGPTETVTKAERSYAPSANEKTVHSKANLRALQEQLRQAEKGEAPKVKEPLDFDHELLLGHVSMLTSLRIAQCNVGDHRGTFIITADRDEHVRISRGPPQSYVTEGYCLGHTQFVSKLCFPDPEAPELLVSGGGDDELRVWDWTQQRCLRSISMAEHVRRFEHGHSGMESSLPSEPSQRKAVVSGLWALEAHSGQVRS